jgi:hypothetical protein
MNNSNKNGSFILPIFIAPITVSIVTFFPEYSVIPSLSIRRYSTGAGQ